MGEGRGGVAFRDCGGKARLSALSARCSNAAKRLLALGPLGKNWVAHLQNFAIFSGYLRDNEKVVQEYRTANLFSSHYEAISLLAHHANSAVISWR